MNVFRTTLAFSLALSSLAAGSAAAAPPENGGQIAKLLSQSHTALGGAALDRAGVISEQGKVNAGGLAGTSESWSEIGGVKFAESYNTPPLEGGDGYDGTSVWNRDGSGLVWVDGGQSGRVQEIAQAFMSNYELWSPNHGGATVVWGGPKTAGGHTYDSLGVTPPGSPLPFEIWFDRTTHLPERTYQAVGQNWTTTILSDYRPVSGVMVPYAIHTEDNTGNVSDLKLTQVVANAPDGAAHLPKPASNVHDFSIAQSATQTSVPIELIDNHVYLSVMLNGKGPYRFIFDTGGLNLVDPAVAKEIGSSGSGSFQGQGVGSSSESVSFAKVSTLQVGDATLKDQLFFVAPTRAGFGTTAGQPVDGLIGFEVLARFVTTFDYGGNRVIFAMPGAQPPAGAGIVPFVLDGKQPQFACSIDNIATQCTLDTGARDSITLLSPFVADHPQVVPATVSAEGVNGFGLGGPAMGKLGRIARLGIGDYTLENIVADFSTQTKGAFASPFTAANVGGGVWKRFSLTLDYNALKMALLPNDGFKEQDFYERAGLFLINHDGAMVVIDSRPGTPAAQAGIVKGDTIATIDGKPTSAMSLQDVRKLFSGAPGTALQVGLTAKDGSKRTVTVTLRDYI
jgi:Aspartyl protease/PDZ domain